MSTLIKMSDANIVNDNSVVEFDCVHKEENIKSVELISVVTSKCKRQKFNFP